MTTKQVRTLLLINLHATSRVGPGVGVAYGRAPHEGIMVREKGVKVRPCF